jgi:hypothetical protein
VPWKATSISTTNTRCRKARRVIRRYAKPRDCQFQERCRIRRWVCRTSDARGSRFDERCTKGSRVVSWHGSYVSS